ncbi:MAG: PEGA domain-containing protein [Terriglobales bacterium]|jgi:serine/threonine protein kinase
MATMFGRFEIQSELSKSETALIYKAMDSETNQVVALKTQSLEPLGDRADAFVEALIAEGESTRELVLPNIVLLYGAGEIDGQFCAAMEYIQGNSIATMLARKEGFSIWDLLDITRQVCGALEHAAAKGVTHYSLEPAKIMVQWDGMVKILGYGISTMSLIEAESGKGLGRLLPYCSPEQTRGEALDLRSNLFTLGAILYEMVVGRLAFDGADPATLASRIQDDTPATPSSVNPKIHPAVSALIMKALAKDPAQRYQTARELVDDLEKCKENKKAAPDTKRPTQAPKVEVNAAARAAAASKFASAPSSAPAASAPAVAPKPVAPAPPRPVAPRPVPSGTSPANPPAAENRATAAAAGAGSGAGARRLPNAPADSSLGSSAGSNYGSNYGSKSDPGLGSSYGSNYGSKPGAKSDSKSNADSDSDFGSQPMGEFEVSGPESQAAPSPVLSAAVVEPETEQESPCVAVDPMMSEPAASSAGTSFSDLAEMPPLKEPVLPPPVPEPIAAPRPTVQFNPRKTEEKPRMQPREVAGKAINQIATVPPRLMLYSILGAVGLILVIVIVLFFHVRSEDDGSTAAPQPTKAAKSSEDEPVEQTPVAPRVQNPAPAVAPITEAQPSLTVRQVEKRNANNRRRQAPAPVPVVIPGQALIDSTPQGAQFQVDGRSDPSWVTPFTVVNLGPGKHVVSVSKAGYSSDIRSVEVAAGSKSSLVLHLAPVNALMVVNSTPAGASVILDGKSTGRVTPAQFAVEKGTHTILLRKQGYLDETATADLSPAQNFQYSPALRALGNADEIRTVGKFNKMFGRGGDSTAGMGTISIHTQPKGAQIAINQRLLEKLSPVDIMLGPGNYIVDITLTGFKPVHKVINVDKAGKTPIDETLERE